MADVIAQKLSIPLDICVPRKIGHPAHPEYAIGALTETGDVRLDEEALAASGLHANDKRVMQVIEREKQEAQRRLKAYRGGRAELDLRGKKVILVDDGIATGATIRAAITSARARGAKEVCVAAPVGAHDSVELLRKEADKVCCSALCCSSEIAFPLLQSRDFEQVVVLEMPQPFHAVGLWIKGPPRILRFFAC